MELLPVRAGYSLGGSVCSGQQTSAERALSRLGGAFLYERQQNVYMKTISLELMPISCRERKT